MTPSNLIYIVDDGADYRFLVQQVFKMYLNQYQARFFSDGVDLLNSPELKGEGKEVLPKVIVLDVDMPRLDGFQTLQRLKLLPQWQTVPVVLMTNRIDEDYQQEGYRLGASSFRLKPLDLMALKTEMTVLCEFEGDFMHLPGSHHR